MNTVLLVNGPNLNDLGRREPHIYGHTTLPDIVSHVRDILQAKDIELKDFQSNSEGSIIDWLYTNKSADFLIINAAALTHTSIALADTLAGLNMPFIEVHISNVYSRESFRHHSYLSPIAKGVIVGMGVDGYYYAAQHAIKQLLT